MERVTTALLARACRIFMDLAYPAGPDSIPAKKRLYYDMPADRSLTDYLPPTAQAVEVCQAIPAAGGGLRGWAFRLGSSHFPHLKLKVQQVDFDNRTEWVFMVDTHDAYSKTASHPPPGSPDAAAWTNLQNANRQLKEAIERGFEAAGLLTFNGLLRGDLKMP